MTVGERIAARRKELNMTQEELARKMGYKSKSSINKIELEWSNVPLSKLEKVASALDCDPAYLMGWEEQPLNGARPGFDLQFFAEPPDPEQQERDEELLSAFRQLPPDYQALIIAQTRAIAQTQKDRDVP